jgi:putative sigma-54 modulation protein
MIRQGGTLFRSEERSDTFNNAMDEAIESLERQIRKNKTRLQRQLRDTTLIDFGQLIDTDVEEETEFKIRRKSFPFKPMSAEEAILQMNLLGHAFYAFTDQETQDVCVVYKRKDGNYGLIMPE